MSDENSNQNSDDQSIENVEQSSEQTPASNEPTTAMPGIPVFKDPSEMTEEERQKYEEDQRLKKEYIEKFGEELKPIEEELKKILSEKYDIEIGRLNMDFELVPSLDSIDYLNFLLDVKRQFDLEIDAAELPNFRTLGDVVIIVHKGLEFKKNNPTPPSQDPPAEPDSGSET